MTPIEFTAWLEGFAENIKGVPSEAQWSRLKEQLAKLNMKTTSGKVYLDATCPTRSVMSAASVTLPRDAATLPEEPEEIIGTA